MANEDEYGTPKENLTGVRKAAQTATDAIGREASALATGAADHPYTATGLTLTIGLLSFAIGYVMGRSSVDTKRSYWR